ncbi:mRNA-degrading endonuclease toxin of MazEF toxin-antitoxin module [Kitasatospora sp. MAP12-15]|uniref:type II toxin-antitoxin system PemK/MazF family toxin n=1 Tax=unclassified Kitasatospora TaxID=2633591 RepID=UPI00247496DF|nr:type II toxin-antitoxin system PemK/MazF family toxin [Kitasatospora sp. MAP12-44]MDH6110705.1 mRNA-degrading endonuclease toxin of MazEF toxin-antitoxin module [Kitasatospora sp. MAP12-44]
MNHVTEVLAALAIVIAVIVAVVRSLRSPAERPTTVRPGTGTGRPPAGGPAPREIWWAEVPFEDGPGAKDRPCLVLRVDGRTATVVKITSKHHAERPGVLALPPGSVGDREGRTSWLETDELRDVPLAHFRRRVGPVDAQTWARTQRAVR